MTPRLWLLAGMALASCRLDPPAPEFGGSDSTSGTTGTVAEDGTNGSGTTSGGMVGTDSGSTAALDDGSGDDDVVPKLDVGEPAPVFPPPPETPPDIPQTCAAAERFETSVGCRFYPVDLDQSNEANPMPGAPVGAETVTDAWPLGLAVANSQSEPASVTLEMSDGGPWAVIGEVEVAASDLHVFQLGDHHLEGAGIKRRGAYRLTSTIPVSAYQANPVLQGSFSSDASMLLPASSWDYDYTVVLPLELDGITYGDHAPTAGDASEGYATIVAHRDDTVVTVVPSHNLLFGPELDPQLGRGALRPAPRRRRLRDPRTRPRCRQPPFAAGHANHQRSRAPRRGIRRLRAGLRG